MVPIIHIKYGKDMGIIFNWKPHGCEVEPPWFQHIFPGSILTPYGEVIPLKSLMTPLANLEKLANGLVDY